MLCAILMLLLQAPSAQGSAPSPTPPQAEKKVSPARVSIAPAGRVDLGSLGPRELKRQSYTLTNTSSAPIRFRVLELSPGVTIKGPALQADIPPKGQATLALQIDPTGLVGHHRGNVRLGTDDPDQGFYYLPLGFLVRPDLTVDAERKGWGALAPHESPALSFRFKRETGMPLQLRIESPLPPHLEATVEAAGGETELRLVLRPEKLEPGVRVGLEVIKVALNAPQQPAFTLYADWQLKWPVEAHPQRVIFLDRGETSRTLILKSSDGRSFRVRSARIEGSGFKLAQPVPSGSVPERVLSIVRTGDHAAKALLVIDLEGIGTPLKVPLSSLVDPQPVEDAASTKKSNGS